MQTNVIILAEFEKYLEDIHQRLKLLLEWRGGESE